MTLRTAFHRALEECDIAAVRTLWAHIAPHLHQPQTDAETLATIHIARTNMELMPFKLRAYSHRWCVDHGVPSQLPDELKPRAERLYPLVSEGVGISVNARDPEFEPVAKMVQGAMSTAVLDVYSFNKHPNVKLVRMRMAEAKRTTIRKLLGR